MSADLAMTRRLADAMGCPPMQQLMPGGCLAGRADILGRPIGDLAVSRRIGYLPENPYF